MDRLACAALFSVCIAAPVTAQTTSTPSWRIEEISLAATEPPLPALAVGSYGRLGLGVFGLKSETVRSRAVTVREISAPRPRRPGLGFSLKF